MGAFSVLIEFVKGFLELLIDALLGAFFGLRRRVRSYCSQTKPMLPERPKGVHILSDAEVAFL